MLRWGAVTRWRWRRSRPVRSCLTSAASCGIDVLLSARRVAPGGRAFGLDMTDEMLELARRNQAEAGVENAEFFKGEIEDVPLPDGVRRRRYQQLCDQPLHREATCDL